MLHNRQEFLFNEKPVPFRPHHHNTSQNLHQQPYQSTHTPPPFFSSRCLHQQPFATGLHGAYLRLHRQPKSVSALSTSALARRPTLIQKNFIASLPCLLTSRQQHAYLHYQEIKLTSRHFALITPLKSSVLYPRQYCCFIDGIQARFSRGVRPLFRYQIRVQGPKNVLLGSKIASQKMCSRIAAYKNGVRTAAMSNKPFTTRQVLSVWTNLQRIKQIEETK